jgi:hypothetical protein
MYVCMYVCISGGHINPHTATYGGLLCFPFYSSPQQSCASNKTQDLVCGGIEIVTWLHKVLTKVMQSPIGLYMSHTRWYLYKSKIFMFAFVAIWLLLAPFTIICQWFCSLPTPGNWCCQLLTCNKLYWSIGNTLVPLHMCSSLPDRF